MEERKHQIHRPPIAPIKVPSRPVASAPRSLSFSHSIFPSTPPSFPSPSPTPKSRPRPPESPAWLLILLFHTLPFYISYTWINSAPLTIFVFVLLLSSSFTFSLLQEKQARTLIRSSLSPSQWGLLFGNGLLTAVSVYLKLDGLRTCGPLITIMSEYAGTLLACAVFRNSQASTIRGVLITILGLVLLSQGWTIESCSPLGIKATGKSDITKSGILGILHMPKLGICPTLPVWSPILSGFLHTLSKTLPQQSSLRMIPKKRVQGLTSVCAVLLLLPFLIFHLDGLFAAHASAIWPLVSVAVIGFARSIAGDFYFEDRLLMPPGSPRHVFITFCCCCLLDLFFSLDISPLGFLLCSAMLFAGVRELSVKSSAFSWDSIAEKEASDSFIKGPLRHILTDRKSRKIALFLAINAAFMVVEFISGFMSNSLGLVSDACHMLFDCAALAIGLYASYISRLRPNTVFGYGYGRFEVLSGYANAVFLVLIGSLIVLESIERILDPPEISTEKLLLVSVGGLLVNVVGLIFFHEEHHHAHHHHGHEHGHHHHEGHEHKVDKLYQELNSHGHNHGHHGHEDHTHGHHDDHQHKDCGHDHGHSHEHHDHQHQQEHDDHGHQVHERSMHGHHNHEHQHHELGYNGHHGHEHNMYGHTHMHDHGHHHHHIDHNMQGIFLHVLADTLGSVGVVISTLLIKYKGWMFADPACSIFISAMIIVSAVPLLRNSAEILLQRTPRSVEKHLYTALDKIRHVEGVVGVDKVHVWSFTNTDIVGTAHVHVLSTADKSFVREKAFNLLKMLGITDLTIQVEEI